MMPPSVQPATSEGPPAVWKPAKWEHQLDNIRLMRADRDAPVDRIGASKLAESTAPAKV